MAPSRFDMLWGRVRDNPLTLFITRIVILGLTVVILPLMFFYLYRMNKVYNSLNEPAPLWVTVQGKDYVYFGLLVFTLVLHLHPRKSLFAKHPITGLIVLFLLAYVWMSISLLWFTDLIFLGYVYDPSKYPIKLTPTPTETIMPTPTMSSFPTSTSFSDSLSPTLTDSLSTLVPTLSASVTDLTSSLTPTLTTDLVSSVIAPSPTSITGSLTSTTNVVPTLTTDPAVPSVTSANPVPTLTTDPAVSSVTSANPVPTLTTDTLPSANPAPSSSNAVPTLSDSMSVAMPTTTDPVSSLIPTVATTTTLVGAVPSGANGPAPSGAAPISDTTIVVAPISAPARAKIAATPGVDPGLNMTSLAPTLSPSMTLTSLSSTLPSPSISSLPSPSSSPAPGSAPPASRPRIYTNTEVLWAGECHSPEGKAAWTCQVNGIYHVLGTLLAFALFFEMTISWWMDMQVESPEQKLKRLKAEDDQKKAKEDAKNWIKNRPRI